MNRSKKRSREVSRKIFIAVLERIGEFSEHAADMFDVYLEAGYGASFSRLQYLQRKKEGQRDRERFLREERKKCSSFISYLKRVGLVGGKHGEELELTKAGKKRLDDLKKIHFQRVDYVGVPSSSYTVIVFDVPQSEKTKRRWIREALRNMGFELVQKSVWAGKLKVPEEFIEDIFNQKMESYVHIFKASDKGSLERK